MNFMKVYEGLWRFMKVYEGLWRFMKVYDGLWWLMETATWTKPWLKCVKPFTLAYMSFWRRLKGHFWETPENWKHRAMESNIWPQKCYRYHPLPTWTGAMIEAMDANHAQHHMPGEGESDNPVWMVKPPPWPVTVLTYLLMYAIAWCCIHLPVPSL